MLVEESMFWVEPHRWLPSRPAACEQAGAWPLAWQAAEDDVVKAQEEDEHELQEEASSSEQGA